MRSHHDAGNIGLEEPLFIDPSTEDPELFISFRREIPYAIDGNSRGQRTIEALGLDRGELNEERRVAYEKLRAVYLVAYVLPPSPDTEWARAVLEAAVE